jgi:hypothetical protein
MDVIIRVPGKGQAELMNLIYQEVHAMKKCLIILLAGGLAVCSVPVRASQSTPDGVTTKSSKSEDDAFAAIRSQAMLYAKKGKDDLVTQSCSKLIADFGSRADLAVALSQVADECRGFNRHDPAILLYQYLLEHWPNSEDAILRQANVITCQRCVKKDAEADAAMQKFVATYKDHPNFRRAACNIGDGLRWWELNWGKAREAYALAASGGPYPDMIWAKAGLAVSCIRLNDYAAAAPLVQELVGSFGNDNRISQALTSIADAYRYTSRRVCDVVPPRNRSCVCRRW